MAAELLDDPAPAPPVLRPAVQEQHRRPRAGRDQMQADGAGNAPDVDPVVLDATAQICHETLPPEGQLRC